MTYYVTKEIPQRGAETTTCTGPCRAERRPETCGPMMTSILSPVEMDYDIAIIQDMEMVRGEAHSTGSLDICLYSQVCSRPPVNRILGRKLPKKDAMMSEASPRPGLY